MQSHSASLLSSRLDLRGISVATMAAALRRHKTFHQPRLYVMAITAGVLLVNITSVSVLQAQQGAAPIVQPGAPGLPSRTLPPGTHAVASPTSAADVSFMQGMVMHHGQAVQMCALIPAHTSNPVILDLGKRISLSQSDEMRFMQRWLSDRHQPISMAMPGMPDMMMDGSPMPAMPGMLTPAQMDALGQAHGLAFDHLFLSGMIQHHGGALVMVKDLFNSPAAGQDADLFNFATDVDNTQRAEIRIMQGLLATNPTETR